MTTEARARRGSYRRRMAAAALAAIGGFLLLAILGPDEDRLQDWLFHTGVEGELRILPSIEIIDDTDPVEQTEQETMPSASRGLDVEVVDRKEEPLSPLATEAAPRERGRPDPTLPTTAVPGWGVGGGDQTVDRVRMVRPSQRSLDFILVKMVQPRYPADAPRWLRLRKVVVDVAIYVESDGTVSDAYILRSEGDESFSRAVLDAVLQWRYRYVGSDGHAEPFWDQVRWIFEARLAVDGGGIR